MKQILIGIFVVWPGIICHAQNQNISNGNVFDGEPYLAVNPANPQHMVVAWMSYVFPGIAIRTRATFDGGRTWGAVQVIPHTNPLYDGADPSLDFDNAGNLFLAFVDFDESAKTGAVVVVKSTDGGRTWGAPVEVINAAADVQKPIDRPWIAVDRSGGPHDGTIYVTTMPPTVFGYLPPPYRPYLTVSTDGGNSFHPWRYLDSAGWLAGNLIRSPMPTPCVAADGTFHAVYPSYMFSQNLLPRYIIASSTDGGSSFTYHTVFSAATGSKDPDAKKGYLLLADPSDSSHLVFAYLELDYGDLDVFIRESYDKGATWGNPIRVNDDPTANNRIQDLLWGDFDTDGDLLLAWRDRRNGTDSTYATAYEIWGAYRKKGAGGFSPNFRISDTLVAYDSILALSGNDFMCVRLVGDTLNAVWGDTRNGTLNIWFQRMTVDGAPVGIRKIYTEKRPSVEIYPNPTADVLTVTGKRIRRIVVYSAQGKPVKQYEAGRRIDVHDLPAGPYWVHVVTREGTIITKMIKTE